MVIPLLNGVDHVAVLRDRYASVVPGAIRAESERVASGHIRHRFGFLRVDLAGADTVVGELQEAGVDARLQPDEVSLLWSKLAFLAPTALATTALDGPLGAVRDDERYHGCQNEVLAVGRAVGAQFDEAALRALQQGAPAEMRSSMQRDVAAGRAPELDAIAGPILRGGSRHGIAVPYTEELARLVAAVLPDVPRRVISPEEDLGPFQFRIPKSARVDQARDGRAAARWHLDAPGPARAVGKEARPTPPEPPTAMK